MQNWRARLDAVVGARDMGDAGGAVLVGRERELAALRRHRDDAMNGRGSVVLIGGEAGIGKTALAETICAEAEQQGALVLIGRCYDLTETPPYGPWVEAFARYPSGDGLPPLPPAFATRGTVSAVASQDVLFRQVSDFFASLAATRPVVLLRDDLHWADPASLDLLRFLARSVSALPLLIIATYRADELTRRHPLYALLPLLERESAATRLDLRRLSPDAIRALVAARYRLPAADTDRLVGYLDARAEGNAFFTLQLLRALEEGDALRSDNAGGWTVGDLDRIHVPLALRQVIDGRLARLGEEAQRLLAVAAVIGLEVPLDIWATVGDTDEETLLDLVERAVGARLVDETEDGTGVRFAHALIREALYEGVSAMRRRRLHAQIGEAVIATGAPDPDTIAHHFRRAGDARQAEWLVRAGERAARSSAEVSAIARFEEALPLVQAAGPSRAQFIVLLNLAALQRWSRVGVAYAEEAAAAARAVSDPIAEAEALLRVGMYRTFAEDLAAGLEDLQRADAMLASPPDRDAHWFTAYYRERSGVPPPQFIRSTFAMTLALLGRFADAEAYLDSGDVSVNAVAGRTLCAAVCGHPAEAHAAVRRGLAALEPREDHRNSGALLGYELASVIIPYYADDAAEVRRVADAASAAFERVGEVAVGFPTRSMALQALILQGEWEEAWSLLPAIRPYLRSAVAGVVNGAFIGTLALGRGAMQLAADLVVDILPRGPETEPGTVPFRVGLGFQETAIDLCLDRGDAAGARAWLEAHDRWLDWNGAVLGRSEGHALWARYHRLAGDRDQARGHAERALADATEPRQPLALLAAHRLLGELEAESGRYEDAARHLDASLRLAEECLAPYERALTLLAVAELRAADGQRDDALRLLDEVRSVCIPLGAAPALARVDDLQARLSVAPHPAPSYPAGLSAREVEVLRLVAQGLTNSQVAERLFLSPRTIEQHLRSIYNKLGVSTRAAATRFAIEHRIA